MTQGFRHKLLKKANGTLEREFYSARVLDLWNGLSSSIVWLDTINQFVMAVIMLYNYVIVYYTPAVLITWQCDIIIMTMSWMVRFIRVSVFVGLLTEVWFVLFELHWKQEMKKIRFKVLYATSQDNDFRAVQLNEHSLATKGWLSERYVTWLGAWSSCCLVDRFC